MGRNGAREGKEEGEKKPRKTYKEKKKQTGEERKNNYQRPVSWFKCSADNIHNNCRHY